MDRAHRKLCMNNSIHALDIDPYLIRFEFSKADMFDDVVLPIKNHIKIIHNVILTSKFKLYIEEKPAIYKLLER